jgi:hypothetical protein
MSKKFIYTVEVHDGSETPKRQSFDDFSKAVEFAQEQADLKKEEDWTVIAI